MTRLEGVVNKLSSPNLDVNTFSMDNVVWPAKPDVLVVDDDWYRHVPAYYTPNRCICARYGDTTHVFENPPTIGWNLTVKMFVSVLAACLPIGAALAFLCGPPVTVASSCHGRAGRGTPPCLSSVRPRNLPPSQLAYGTGAQELPGQR